MHVNYLSSSFHEAHEVLELVKYRCGEHVDAEEQFSLANEALLTNLQVPFGPVELLIFESSGC